MLLRYLAFVKIIQSEFADITNDIELHIDRIHLELVNHSWIEIRYPVLGKFSFHWQFGKSLYRFDTTPHHPNLTSFPRHIHCQKEENVVEDKILTKDGTPEEHLNQFLT
ncbi:MAG: hypothetical protein RBG13Loki_2803 [Promethearchaeota archaeon CR_4]|nr:MAG: hypothetical protein RBG13Loki_2803 [Candidatus Lokiarchaeota archaeon CR_4]